MGRLLLSIVPIFLGTISLLSSLSFATTVSTPSSASACPSGFAKVDKLARDIAAWKKLTPAQRLVARRKNMLTADANPSAAPERRIKQLVTGDPKDAHVYDPADKRLDFADPSLPMPITYPNGVTKYRINASGHRYIETDEPMNFFKGGPFVIRRSRGFYPDGTEMTGAYHTEAWPWDVVMYQNDDGKWIAFGGVMEQSKPGTLPTVAKNNPSRSRWWGQVKHVEIAPGVYEDHVLWQGPLNDFNKEPKKPGDWTWHGYGGTLMTEWNPKTGLHEPVKLPNGHYLLNYERVAQQKEMADGTKVPYVTTLYAREVDPSLQKTVGPEYKVFDINSSETGKPYLATKRGTPEEDAGYLAEGGNYFKLRDGRTVLAFSTNDYVRRYGVNMATLPKGADPRGTFSPVLNEKKDLQDFATSMDLRRIVNGRWFGRPQLVYAPDGSLWMEAHYVPNETAPASVPVEGWPKTKEEFIQMGRLPAMIPVKVGRDARGQTTLKLDVAPEFQYLYSN